MFQVSRLLDDAGHLEEVLKEGGERAREIACDTMEEVRRLVGFRS